MEDASARHPVLCSALLLATACLAAPALDAQQPAPGGRWPTLARYNASSLSADEKQRILEEAGVHWDFLHAAWRATAVHPQSALLVVRDGTIVGEWGPGLSAVISVQSVNKWVTANAIHRAVDLGLLTESTPLHTCLPASWLTGDPRQRRVTLHHVLTMTSGIMRHDGPQPTPQYASLILSLPMVAEPGTLYHYSSAPVDLLSLAVRLRTGSSLSDFFCREIGDRIGITSFVWRTTGAEPIASGWLIGWPRDFARLMYLDIHGGQWDDGTGAPQQVLSPGSASKLIRRDPALAGAAMASPLGFATPDATERYAHLAWTDVNHSAHVSALAPADMVYAAGVGNAIVAGVPSEDLIFVRGSATGQPYGWDEPFIRAVQDDVFRSLATAKRTRLAGCASGSSAVRPRSTYPIVGGTWRIDVPAAPAPMCLLIGLRLDPPQPVGNGCVLHVDTATPHVAIPVAAGSALALSARVPNTPACEGTRLAVQAVLGPHLASDALGVEIGR